jgi:hypothetical protein
MQYDLRVMPANTSWRAQSLSLSLSRQHDSLELAKYVLYMTLFSSHRHLKKRW